MCGLEGYRIIPYKGDYYNTTEEVIRGLVYPVPDSPLSLGIHLTRTLGNEILIGPSVLKVTEKEDYEIRTPRKEFEEGALSMIPDLNIREDLSGLLRKSAQGLLPGGVENRFRHSETGTRTDSSPGH